MSRLTEKFNEMTVDIRAERDEAVKNFKIENNRRRKLLDELQMLKGSIRVICRVRPRLGDELTSEAAAINVDATGTITADSISTGIAKRGKTDKFNFSHTFGPDSTQEQVFEEVSSLVDAAVDGYHSCIFAYGQTGSGKTHTMEGTPENPGINIRAFRKLFDEIEKRKGLAEYRVRATMVEIYNEKLRDLLRESEDGPIGSSGLYTMDTEAAANAADNALHIRTGQHGMEIEGAICQEIQTYEQVAHVFQVGRANRAIAATACNAQSSRSHAVLLVDLEGTDMETQVKTHGRLVLVDLAGSERINRSGVQKGQLTEAQNINKSLSALGDVIGALTHKSGHVPFRNSTLTFLLKDSLGKDNKALMLVQVIIWVMTPCPSRTTFSHVCPFAGKSL